MEFAKDISAIILAAGLSSRMGRFKPLLPLGNATVLARVVTLYRSAGIRDICVVVGHKADKVKAALESHEVRWVQNPEYQHGMFSSVTAGLGALPCPCRGFFVHPVDIPLVRRSTMIALMEAFHDDAASVWQPIFDGCSGHPPLVPAALAPEILKWSGRDGLRGFWTERNIPMKTVPVADQAILWDLDTEEDYHRLQTRLNQEDIPSYEACRVLMTQVVDVPQPVWRHCQATAGVAIALAEAVNRAGGLLDVDLIRSAALLHDIAKTEKQHAVAGAKLMETLDYPGVAAVIKVHMDIETLPEQPLDEAQIVFLADKLLEGPRLSSLDNRMAHKIAKYGLDEATRQAIARRFQMARWIQEKVERAAQSKIKAILSKASLDIE